MFVILLKAWVSVKDLVTCAVSKLLNWFVLKHTI